MENMIWGKKTVDETLVPREKKRPMANMSGTEWSWVRSGWHGQCNALTQRHGQTWHGGQTQPGGSVLQRGEWATARPGAPLCEEKEKLADWAGLRCSAGFWPKAR
jgi:hypothetical protein